MLKVSNKPCIRNLANKSFKASRSRNIIAVLAIALTTVLFTALFTIGSSMNEAFQQSNFRQVGGFSHGGFKYLTKEQFLELKDDPLIKEWGVGRVLGMGTGEKLNKNHVEVRYSDASDCHFMFLEPIEGRFPKEGTNEAATDLEVLRLLGAEPKIGTEFTVLVDVCGQPVKQVFTLCGWWEKDPITAANHIIIPESRVDEVLEDMEITLPTKDKITGSWNLDVMFKDSRHIERDLNTVLKNHGYQSEVKAQLNYIDIGVNWGYTGAQFSQNTDFMTAAAVIVLLLLIVLTGYLIIYNVFQISVVNDIQYYGLLKTIGTTGRQVKSILRQQALRLCVIGIPLGCICGWFIGAKLSPFIMGRFNGLKADTISVSPWIFAESALFALFTVFISCARPGRIASKVSPVEAVRYTESNEGRKKQRKGVKKVSVFNMAAANLGRSKGRTFVTVLSLTLAVVLLQMTTIFTNGFDMDKYLQDKAVCDFILADGGYFSNNVNNWRIGKGALPKEVIEDISRQEGIVSGGCVYGQMAAIQQFAPKEWVRKSMIHRGNSEESTDYNISKTEQTPDGRVMNSVQTYGMEPFVLDKIKVFSGDLSQLYKPGSRAIAAVYSSDDYGKVVPDSHWAVLGDTVTLRIPEKWEYFDPKTGEIYKDAESANGRSYMARPSVYHDETFTVEALVLIPHTINYRYYGNDEFILNCETFKEITKKSDVMLYAFDVEKNAEASIEEFLYDYTENKNPQYGYESKQIYIKEFDSMRSMFLVVGSLLSFVVGLIGILNFINAVLTGIFARRREFAVLQSIGMTGKQLKNMLVTEGILYSIGSVVLALVFSLAAGPAAALALEKMFWFFAYRPSYMPILAIAPIFAFIGCAVPLLVYKSISKQTIVERLRESEN